jgi:peptidoglycan/LPS O-acetylase OafA/YrhL
VKSYRADIDGLRAVAVVTVLLFHGFPGVLSGGFVGVDIFFVISGYLITGILLANLDRGALHLMNFYRHRVRRIFPSLLIVLTISFAFGLACAVYGGICSTRQAHRSQRSVRFQLCSLGGKQLRHGFETPGCACSGGQG